MLFIDSVYTEFYRSVLPFSFDFLCNCILVSYTLAIFLIVYVYCHSLFRNKVSDLKHEVITHNRRWRYILAVLHNSCTRFSGFYNVNDISTSSDSFKTTFECKESENPEQVQSFFKDTCDSKNESHAKLDNFATEFFESKLISFRNNMVLLHKI